MSQKVIYIPGIGDHRPWFQDKLLRLWRLFGVKATFWPVGWADGEVFEPKLKRLVAKIDELSADGQPVALIGVSAGASAALNAYVQRKDKISAVVFVVGKIYGTDNVNPRYYRNNPAFKESLASSDAVVKKLNLVDRAKMLYVYTPLDKTVIPRVNRPSGITAKRILAPGHISGIYIAITAYAYSLAKFIKRRSKNSH